MWETNLKMIEQHNREYNQGKHSFTMAMNGFGDMVSVAWIAERFVLSLFSTLPKKSHACQHCSFFS